jgi:hypothetical protein
MHFCQLQVSAPTRRSQTNSYHQSRKTKAGQTLIALLAVALCLVSTKGFAQADLTSFDPTSLEQQVQEMALNDELESIMTEPSTLDISKQSELQPLNSNQANQVDPVQSTIANEKPGTTFGRPLPPEQTNLTFPLVPDPSMTTGSICQETDADFTEHRYGENIAYCARNVASFTKKEIYQKYGVKKGCRTEYTIDHFIPLSIGGTNTIDNLWPEHNSIKALRQNLEVKTFRQLEKGQITQAEAISIIVSAKWHPPADQVDPSSICR